MESFWNLLWGNRYVALMKRYGDLQDSHLVLQRQHLALLEERVRIEASMRELFDLLDKTREVDRPPDEVRKLERATYRKMLGLR